MTELLGVDVSHFQGVIDWPAVAKSGVQFAMIKATEGTGFVDPRYVANRDKEIECRVGIHRICPQALEVVARLRQQILRCLKLEQALALHRVSCPLTMSI